MVFQARFAIVVRSREPCPADDRKQHITGRHGILENPHKIYSGPEGVDIHEDIRCPETRTQPVIDTTCLPAAILPSVTYEDTGHRVRARITCTVIAATKFYRIALQVASICRLPPDGPLDQRANVIARWRGRRPGNRREAPEPPFASG